MKINKHIKKFIKIVCIAIVLAYFYAFIYVKREIFSPPAYPYVDFVLVFIGAVIISYVFVWVYNIIK